VAEDLNLDMPGALDHLLQIEAAIAECGKRLGLGLRDEAVELLLVVGDANATAAAAGRRLYHGREAGTRGRLARGDLVAHHADRIGAGPDKDEAGDRASVGELGVLCEETIA